MEVFINCWDLPFNSYGESLISFQYICHLFFDGLVNDTVLGSILNVASRFRKILKYAFIYCQRKVLQSFLILITAFSSLFFWTCGSTQKGSMQQGLPTLRSSFCPFVLLSRHFLEIVSLVFSKFKHGARNLYEVVCNRARFCQENFFCPQNWENGPKMVQNQGFLNLLKTFVLRKIYIQCVSAQISYLGKFLFQEYQPKYSQPIRLQDVLTNHISRVNW